MLNVLLGVIPQPVKPVADEPHVVVLTILDLLKFGGHPPVFLISEPLRRQFPQAAKTLLHWIERT